MTFGHAVLLAQFRQLLGYRRLCHARALQRVALAPHARCRLPLLRLLEMTQPTGHRLCLLLMQDPLGVRLAALGLGLFSVKRQARQL